MPIAQDVVDILFQLSLDTAAQERLSKGLTTTKDELEEIAEALGMTEDAAQEAERFMTKYAEAYDKAAQEAEAFKRTIEDVADKTERISRTMIAGGVSIIGGLAASAQSYIKFMQDAGVEGDEVVNRWTAAMDRMKNASLVVGRAAAEALLPALEKVAELAERAAAFIDENPEAMEAAVNVGQALVALGAFGIAVSKGVKLYLGAQELSAFLANTEALKGLSGIIGGLPGVLGRAGLLGGAIAGGAFAGREVGNVLGRAAYGEDYEEQGFRDVALTATRVANVPMALLAAKLEEMGGKAGELGDFIGDNITKSDQWVQKMLGMTKATDEGGKGIDDLTGSIQRMAKEAEGAKILDELGRDLAKMEADYAQQREKIIRLSQDRVNAVYRRSGRARLQAAESYERNIGNIWQRYNEATVADEQNWAEQRAKILRDAGEEARKIERDLQEDLRKLRLDHEEKVAELVANRDALGLVRERRRYEREKDERERDANRRIAEQRRNAARELQEQRRDYEAKRAQRYAQLQRDLAEAAVQYEQRKKEVARQEAAQLEEIRRAKAAQLRELQIAHRNETRARVLEAHAAIQAIGGALNAERNLRQQYYQYILQDAGAFMKSYRQALTSEGVTPTATTTTTKEKTSFARFLGYARGGYADYGLYMLGDSPGGGKGGREFVMSANTTRAAERAIQGKLTQAGLLNAISQGTGSTINLTLPAGMVQMNQLKDVLRENNDNFMNNLARALEF